LSRTTVLAFARGHHHQLLDEGLRRALAAAALADVDHPRARAGQRHDGVADEVVDQQHGGCGDGA
jgi:hypothetical protein